MKLVIGRATRASIRVVDLRKRSLTVWLTKTARMTIDPGDRLQVVSRAAGEHWPGLSRGVRNKLVAYFFALGERGARNEHGRAWRAKELRADPDRRYLRRRA